MVGSLGQENAQVLYMASVPETAGHVAPKFPGQPAWEGASLAFVRQVPGGCRPGGSVLAHIPQPVGLQICCPKPSRTH